MIMRLTHNCKRRFLTSLLSNNHFHPATVQSTSFHYTEEVLASHIAPLLDQKDSSLLKKSQQIHALIIVNGLHDVGILGTRILGTYLLSNNYSDAQKLFWQLQLWSAAPWNWMIRGFTRVGCYDYAILFYFKMLTFGSRPDKYTYPYLIKACGGLHAIDLLKYVHVMIREFGFEMDVYVGSALVKFYAENGCLDDARKLFDKLPMRDTVLWNVMLNGYLKCESEADNVVSLFREMRKSECELNYVTYASVLSFCGIKSLSRVGAQVHGSVIRCGVEMFSPVANTLVSMYAKCRCLVEARKLFDFITQADLVTWNGIIGGFVQNGHMNEAMDLFRRMISSDVKPDSVTFASLLPSVHELDCPDLGKEIHSYIIKNGVFLDLFLKNSLIDMYFKCNNVDMASKIFEQSSEVDIVIYTSMISGFSLNGMDLEALNIFRFLISKKMRPSAVTFACTLPVCASSNALKLGKELHGNVIRRGLEGRRHVGSAITDMYAKCGRLDLSHRAFSRIPEKDPICWNSIIMSCCQNGKPEEAIDLFRRMLLEENRYDCVSISAMLSACADLSCINHCQEIHNFMIKYGFESDVLCNSALIDAYAKCGYLDLAHGVFKIMKFRNEVSWNSIIAAYGKYGELKQCLALVKEMEDEGFRPDHVTFLIIISCCGHSGAVEEGKLQFNRMVNCGIAPGMEHYACLVDMLGRAGRLEEGVKVLDEMPFTPDAGIWGTLLGAARIHGNLEVAQMASHHLFQLDPLNSGYYVLLSNLHADSWDWERVDQIRDAMKQRRVQKIPASSWIQIHKSNHVSAAEEYEAASS